MSTMPGFVPAREADEAVRVLGTDAITGLESSPDAHVHSIVTSPPYWGLRDYGVAPLVWAPVEYTPMPGVEPIRVPGWASPERYGRCRHIWGEWEERHETRELTIAGKTRTTARHYGADATRRFDGSHHTHRHGQFCRVCGAWRGSLGLEPSPAPYVGHLVQVFRAARRVLSDSGTLWLNLGDRYASDPADGLKRKDLVGIPWRAAYALQADGWYLRSDIVWAKGVSFAAGECGNTMPESVRDRPVRGHEFIFQLARSERYYYDHYAVQEEAIVKPQRRLTQRHSDRDRSMRPDKVYRYRLTDEPVRQQARRNLRDVWRINTRPFRGAHFAVFPPSLVRPILRAATSAGGVCAHCGRPYRRITEREKIAAVRQCSNDPRTGGVLPAHRMDRVGMTHRELSLWLAAHPERSVGWTPGCGCGSPESALATVLDPFAGSGTVGLVALEEGVRAILIEPQADYRRIIRARLGATGKCRP